MDQITRYLIKSWPDKVSAFGKSLFSALAQSFQRQQQWDDRICFVGERELHNPPGANRTIRSDQCYFGRTIRVPCVDLFVILAFAVTACGVKNDLAKPSGQTTPRDERDPSKPPYPLGR